MMRRLVVVIAFGLIVLPMAALAATNATNAVRSPNEAVSTSEVGWWTSRPGALPRGPNKLEIAHDLTGNASIAALRFTIAEQPAKVILILNEETTAVFASSSALRVCPTAAAWTATDGGALAAAPAGDCAKGQLDLARDATFARWTGDIGPLLAANTVDGSAAVVITPVPVKTFGLIDVGFVLPFGSAQVLVPSTGAAPPSVTVPTPTTLSSNTGAPRAASTSGTGLAPRPNAAPVITAVIESTPTTVEAALPPVLIGSAGDTKPWGRLLWLVPLSAAGGFLVAGLRRRFPALAP
jgi:hypothetical protein